MPKFGDIYEWRPAFPHPKGEDGIVVMFVGPYDRTMDSAIIILAMPSGADERLGRVEHVWRVGEHESWRLLNG